MENKRDLSITDLISLKDILPFIDDPEKKTGLAEALHKARKRVDDLRDRETASIKDPTQPDSLVKHYLNENAMLIIKHRPNLIRTLLKETETI